MADELPLRPTTPIQHFGYLLTRLAGWQLDGSIPRHQKYVLIFAPHSSNWDFPLAFTFSRSIPMGIPYWVGKHTLFKGAFGHFLRALGGIPVNRDSPGHFMTQVLSEFEARDQFILALAPEGTRRKTTYWKSGFYKIAVAAGVPIVMASLDYSKQIARIGGAFMPTGDAQADMEIVRDFYAPAVAKFPEAQGEVRLRPRDLSG